MRNILLLISLSLFLFSCVSHEEGKRKKSASNKEQLAKLIGQYYFAETNTETNEIELQESCWTKGLEEFEIHEYAGSPGVFYFAFNGYRASICEVNKCYPNENGSLTVLGIKEEGSVGGYDEFTIKEIENGVYELILGKDSYLLIREENKDKYTYIPCDEGGKINREEEQIEIQELEPEIVKVFYALRDGSDKINDLIPEEGVHLISPGNGLHPIEKTLSTKEEVINTEIFSTKVYKRLVKLIALHYDREKNFIIYLGEEEPFPDRCMPKEEYLYVKLEYLGKREVLMTAMLTKYNDEQEEAYTYCIIKIRYADGHTKIISIDTLDCSA